MPILKNARDTAVNQTTNLVATIANSASLSDIIDLAGTTLVGYEMPIGWTAADITFQGSIDGIDGISFKDLYDSSGIEVNHTVAADRLIKLQPSVLATLRYFKIRSGTSGTPVVQGAERKIKIISRPV